MPSGIYIDDQFIETPSHSVSLYFDTVRAIIDSGRSARVSLPVDTGLMGILVTPATRLRSWFDLGEVPDSIRDIVEKKPFGNFPRLIKEYIVPDDSHWEYINTTALGEAVKALDDSVEAVE